MVCDGEFIILLQMIMAKPVVLGNNVDLRNVVLYSDWHNNGKMTWVGDLQLFHIGMVV